MTISCPQHNSSQTAIPRASQPTNAMKAAPAPVFHIHCYDSNGVTVETTDMQGQVSQYLRDPNTRLVTRTVDPQGRSSRFAYDARNNLVATVDPLGRLTQRSFSISAN